MHYVGAIEPEGQASTLHSADAPRLEPVPGTWLRCWERDFIGCWSFVDPEALGRFFFSGWRWWISFLA